MLFQTGPNTILKSGNLTWSISINPVAMQGEEMDRRGSGVFGFWHRFALRHSPLRGCSVAQSLAKRPKTLVPHHYIVSVNTPLADPRRLTQI
jgi:hypothetical protein